MPSTPDSSYDVIIVGGRPAGASLAARLGARGLSVLVLDKAEFPSQPEVPSSPVIHPASMDLLSEIGIEEDAYAEHTTRIETYVIEFEGHFRSVFGLPELFGRRYLRGIDRKSFDWVLWQNLARFPSVTARGRFSVSDLVRDDTGRVVGVAGREKNGPPESFHAKLCVVGADGRHSLVARKAGARVLEDITRTSTVYQATWEGVRPCTPDRDPAAHVVASGRGQNVLFFPSCPGLVYVVTHTRSDRVEIRGDAQSHYLGVLRSYGCVRARLEGAKQVSRVAGIKRVGNRYLEHGGPGWVLVGDALHHKDPVDGQGIYDALITAKRLAEILVDAHEHRIDWRSALSAYQRVIGEETGPMFRATMKRLEQELFEDPPPFMIRTMLRWMLQDPEYQRRFSLFLGRVIPPNDWRSPSLVLGAMARGAMRDLGRMIRREAA